LRSLRTNGRTGTARARRTRGSAVRGGTVQGVSGSGERMPETSPSPATPSLTSRGSQGSAARLVVWQSHWWPRKETWDRGRLGQAPKSRVVVRGRKYDEPCQRTESPGWWRARVGQSQSAVGRDDQRDDPGEKKDGRRTLETLGIGRHRPQASPPLVAVS